jgi:hypothetical protein
VEARGWVPGWSTRMTKSLTEGDFMSEPIILRGILIIGLILGTITAAIPAGWTNKTGIALVIITAFWLGVEFAQFKKPTWIHFKFNNRKISDGERATKALQGIEGKRLTYRRGLPVPRTLKQKVKHFTSWRKRK